MDAKELAGSIISRLRERSMSGSWTILEIGYGTVESVIEEHISSALSAQAAEVERITAQYEGHLESHRIKDADVKRYWEAKEAHWKSEILRLEGTVALFKAGPALSLPPAAQEVKL